MKPVRFVGTARDELAAFPKPVRRAAYEHDEDNAEAPRRETSGNIFIDLGFPPHEAAVTNWQRLCANGSIGRGSHKRRLPSVWE
jgi:hypothetical protein